ncbi:hypothetical protein T484DRAFT_1756264 [Baffinella frigidus]|nr:hypothetical protein T484DRAFT_1756264 [Cryptophyta sp. CCMP2293]
MPAQAAAETQTMDSRTMARISKTRGRASSTRSRATQRAARLLNMYIKSRRASSPPAGRAHVYYRGASSTTANAAPATTSPAEGATNSPALDHDLPEDHAKFIPLTPPANATPEQEAPACAKSGGRALSSPRLLTRVLGGVLKNIGNVEKYAWWRVEYQADFVHQDLTHEMDTTMYNLGFDTVTKAVLHKAAATIFSRLGVGEAPSLDAVPEEPEAPNSESEDTKCPVSEDGKDGAEDNAPTAGVKATTPANECAEVNVETKTISALLAQDTNAVSGKKELGGEDKVPNSTNPGVKTDTAAKEGAGVKAETKTPASDMKGAPPKDATAGPSPGKHEEPLQHVQPVLNKWEHIIKVIGHGNFMFEAAETGIQANRGPARPVDETDRLALANNCRAKSVKQETDDMRAHLEEAIKKHALFLDGSSGKMITNIDDHAAEMVKQGVWG